MCCRVFFLCVIIIRRGNSEGDYVSLGWFESMDCMDVIAEVNNRNRIKGDDSRPGCYMVSDNGGWWVIL